MKLFKKKPSADAILVQELQLALLSAQETSRTLQHQLQRETQARTTLEMALHEADHRYKTLQESLDLSNKALSTSRAEVRALQDQIHGLHQDDHNISLLKEEMTTQAESFKMVKEAIKSCYGQLKVENGNLLKKIKELEGQLEMETAARTSLEMALHEADIGSKSLQESLDLSNKALSATRAEVRALQDQNNSLHQDNNNLSLLQETMKSSYGQLKEESGNLREKIKEVEGQLEMETAARTTLEMALHDFQKEKKVVKEATLKFKVKAFQIIKHLESSLKEQRDIATKFEQELLQKTEALTEECQKNQTLEAKLTEVRNEQEVTTKKHEEDTSILQANVDELYQNLEKSAKIICNLTETNECLKLTRKELLEWLTESENNVKQLREELRLKTEPQEPQGRQPKNTWASSGRRWRR